MKSAQYWIEKLELQPHPEGGYFKEVYRSEDSVLAGGLPERYSSDRSLGTSIYFLLKGDQISSFHRLRSDELWYFHAGGAADIHLIDPEGELSLKTIGPDVEAGESLQVAIPRGCWFSAELKGSTDFILVGCSVYPGFDFEDFELADAQKLIQEYPNHAELIKKMCLREV